MDSLSDLLNKISINDLGVVGSVHWVDVTHINNPHSFYVRPTEYRMHLPIVNAYGPRLHPSDLQLQQNIVYKSKLIQRYIRGRVSSIQMENGEITCDVYAQDYGCLEKSISIKYVRKSLHSANIQPLAIHCQLTDCQPITETWSEKAVECFKYFVENERIKMVIRGKTLEALIVQLYNSHPDDISTMLAYCNCSMFGYDNNIVSRFASLSSTTQKLYFTFNELNVGEKFNVRVQSGESLTSFYVATIIDYKKYIEERTNFTNVSNGQNDLRFEDIKEGLPVAVLLSHPYRRYERAVVKEINVPNGKAKVQLVDWGKVQEVSFYELKPMPHYYFTYPAIAIYCCTDENQAWDNGLQRFLYPGYEFTISVYKSGNKFDSPHIVNISPLASTSMKKQVM